MHPDRRFSTDRLRAPISPATGLVRLAARVVPAGPARTRYRQEFTAELYGLSRREQVAEAVGILVHSFALRRAVGPSARASIKEVSTMSVSKPLLCRLRFHHYVVRTNPEGLTYRQCSRCGLDHYDDNNLGPTALAASTTGGMAGGQF